MRLLLDAHFSTSVSRPLRADDLDVYTLDEWHNGKYRDAGDDEILAVATAEARILVTYDNHIISDIVMVWAAMGRSHAGIVFISSRTIRQQDVGGLIRALRALVEQFEELDWVDRIMHLPPAPGHR
jgi:predicted nuclease of predicted toxin-antitoxin system